MGGIHPMDEAAIPISSSSRSLVLRVNDRPPIHLALLYACQQASICISGLLVCPFLVSDSVCAGEGATALRVQLIAATFVACGIATLLQTTCGLRLSILNGTAFSFLPPLLSYFASRPCTGDDDPLDRLRVISGSLAAACLVFVLIGITGLSGTIARFVGPVTIVPLMILLSLSTVPQLEQKLSSHWVSFVVLFFLILCVVYLENVQVHLPMIRPFRMVPVRIFNQFPYLISVAGAWLVCLILTVTGAEPEEGPARTDRSIPMKVLAESPWLSVPYPGYFGSPKFDLALFFGFCASALSSIIENLGSYSMAARVSEQKQPPRDAVNRAICVEGIGSIISGLLGCCAGVTTYTENVALIHVTKVASRFTMQIAGLLLILVGCFTKFAAVLASIPDPIIGGILFMGMSMIGGVALSDLKTVDLQLTRNLAIMGMAVLVGMVVTTHFEQHPLDTGNKDVDNIFTMLLTIKMLIGGGFAVILDNTVPGASKYERGLHKEDTGEKKNEEGYALPRWFNRILQRVPVLTKLPFLPSNP